jgi:hypothetical protein
MASSTSMTWPGSVALVHRGGREPGAMTSSGLSSVFAGFWFPREVIAIAVRWYLRYGCPAATSRSCWPSAVSPWTT